jgi:hypothetical protein
MLDFDPAAHVYRWGGKIVPGVTTVLRGLHSMAGVPIEILEAAQQRGTDVHAACEFLDQDDLDEDSLTDQTRGYVSGYRRFLADCEPNYSGIEERVYHTVLGFAGTLDRRGELTYQGARTQAVIDIKTSAQAYPIAWEPQLAAYAHAAGIPAVRRFTLQLRPDGTYLMRECSDPSAWPVFVALLTLYQWKEKHQ